MHSNEYTYWIFFIKEEYLNKIPSYTPSSENRLLYAYTDKKEYAEEFKKIHLEDAFIIKKMKLDRDGVNMLARYFQNNIIRREKIISKDSRFNRIEVKVCLTEKEYFVSENSCYSHVEDLWKYVWEPNFILNTKYMKALNNLNYLYLYKKLEDGKTTYIPNLEADILGSFIYHFKSILTIGDE